MPETAAGIYALKVYLLTGCLSVTLMCVGYFLKRVLDNFDERSEALDARIEKAIEAMAEQNSKIIQVLTQVTYHGERIANIEQRLDKRGCHRQ